MGGLFVLLLVIGAAAGLLLGMGAESMVPALRTPLAAFVLRGVACDLTNERVRSVRVAGVV